MTWTRPHRASLRWLFAPALLATAAVGCELGEVVVPQTDPIVIVQAIMRSDRSQQWILVEQSLTGSVEGHGHGFVPGQAVQVPAEGASVTVSNLSLPSDACGAAVNFTEAAAPDSLLAGVYWAPAGCPTTRPGDTLDLRVEYGDAVTTARTVVPFTDRILLGARGTTVSLPGPTLAFNRDNDTLRAEVLGQGGRGLTLTVHPRPLPNTAPRLVAEQTSWFWADSTIMTLPGDFVNIFEADFESDDDVPDLFVAGQHYTIGVARPDDNYFDFLRSANSPLSGRGFINHVVGGYGLFGSIVAGATEIRVVGNLDDPREATYRFAGELEAVQVDIRIELYIGRPLLNDREERERFAAFVTGDWVHGLLDHSIIGMLDGDRLEAVLEQETGAVDENGFPQIGTWRLTGGISPSASTLTVVTEDGNITTLTRIPLSAAR